MKTVLTAVLFLLYILPSACQITAINQQADDPFSALLNQDGTLNQAKLHDGSFQTGAYRIHYRNNGEPVFTRPEGQQVAGDENWAPDFAIPGVNGQVFAVHIDSNDLYAGGIFTKAGGITVSNIAHWNGNIWTAMGTGIGTTTDQVTGIKKFGNYVYATSTAGVFRWDGNNWTLIGTLTQSLYSTLAASALDIDASGNVYVTGDFVKINGVTVNGIAKWDGSSWSPLSSGIDNPGGGFGVAIAVEGNNVYLGGGFSRVGNVPAINIAKWNGTSWSQLGTGITTTGVVTSLAIAGTNVYVGAPGMTVAGVIPVNNIAKWDGSNWSALASGLNNGPLALCVWGNDLYAGGRFTQSGALPLNKVAKWNGTAWSDAGNGLVMSDGIFSLTINAQYFFAGGGSFGTDPLNMGSLARWNGSRWICVGNGVNDYINCVTISGNTVYIGGKFTEAGGLKVNGIARWDGVSWDSLGSGFSSGEVYDIAVIGNLVYAGGSIAWGGPSGPTYLGVWNGTNWSAVGTGVNSTVFCLEARGTDLYVGGVFSTAGGITVNNIAKWNGSAWSALGFGSNAIVKDIKFTSDGTLYAGGNFTVIGTVAANRIARWNGTSWSAVGSGVNNFVNVIGVNAADEIYIGGAFDVAINGGIVNHLAKWTGSAWVSVGGGVSPASANIYSIIFRGNDMYIGGVFTSAGSTTANNIAKWDGANWSALGSGTNGSSPLPVVMSMGINCNSLFTVGFFIQAGDKRSDRFARYWLDGLPSVTISTPNTTVCNGTNVTFTASPVNGGQSPTLQWQLNGTNVGTNATTYSNSSLPNNARVQVLMTGNTGCIHPVNAASNLIVMTMQPLLTPSVSINTPTTSVCNGANVSFTATAVNGGTNPSYQWQVNGLNAGTNSAIFSTSTLTNNSQVKVILTAAGGCFSSNIANSNTITMTVNPVLVPTITIAGVTTVNQGSSSLITATSQNGGASPNYGWSDSTAAHSWQPITGASGITHNYTPSATGDKLRATMTSNAVCASPVTVTSNELVFTVTPVTAVGNIDARNYGIRYFPNPARNLIVVDSLKQGHHWLTATVRSIDGRKIFSEINISNRTTITIHVEDLPPGIYILVLRQREGVGAFLKFVKQ